MSAKDIFYIIIVLLFISYIAMAPLHGKRIEKREKELRRLKSQIQVIVEQHQGNALLAQESIVDFMESGNIRNFKIYCNKHDPNSWIIIDMDMRTTGRAGEERVFDSRTKSRTLFLFWDDENDLKEWHKVYPKETSEQ